MAESVTGPGSIAAPPETGSPERIRPSGPDGWNQVQAAGQAGSGQAGAAEPQGRSRIGAAAQGNAGSLQAVPRGAVPATAAEVALGQASITAVPATAPVLVLGGTGYVAGELLRLLAGHPHLRLAGVLSESQAGEAVESAFPHLAGCFPGTAFHSRAELAGLLGEIAGRLLPESLVRRGGSSQQGPAVADARPRRPAASDTGSRIDLVVLSAAPHGAAAPLIDGVLAAAERAGLSVRVVDVSADFRFADPVRYADVYGHPHGAPGRLASFRCALPEHLPGVPAGHIAHPGCFTTATLLPLVPLFALGLIEPRVSVVAVTGSTGAGRTPGATTHHPARRSNLFAYSPLAHRHEPEMSALAATASGTEPEIFFLPQAGPFARGIYATLQARLARPATAAEIAAELAIYYAGSPFISVATQPPRLQDVVGSNRCHLGIAVRGDHLAVFSALDNLVKGAAGGALQWANRLLGLPESAGLTQPGPGWV